MSYPNHPEVIDARETQLEQLRFDLHQLLNSASFFTTPPQRREETARAVRFALDNALDLVKYHL